MDDSPGSAGRLNWLLARPNTDCRTNPVLLRRSRSWTGGG